MIYGTSSLDQKYFQNCLPLGASALPVNEVKSENIHKSLLILTFQTSIKALVPHGGLKLDRVSRLKKEKEVFCWVIFNLLQSFLRPFL